MRKLKLHLDQLTVDSFRTAPGDEKKGTVFGEQGSGWTCYGSCDSVCGGCDSNDPSLTVGGPNCVCCW
jgi:hypothetical protein